MKDQMLATVAAMFLHFLQVNGVVLTDQDGKRLSADDMFKLKDRFAGGG